MDRKFIPNIIARDSCVLHPKLASTPLKFTAWKLKSNATEVNNKAKESSSKCTFHNESLRLHHVIQLSEAIAHRNHGLPMLVSSSLQHASDPKDEN